MIAPPLLASEVTSILCELAYRSAIPPEHARCAVTRLYSLTPLGHRPYDAEYVALAQIHDAPLLTIDERLRRGAGHVVEMPTPQELLGR